MAGQLVVMTGPYSVVRWAVWLAGKTVACWDVQKVVRWAVR